FVLLAGCSSTPPKTLQASNGQNGAPSNSAARPAVAGTTAATPSNQSVAGGRPAASAVYFDFDSVALKEQPASVIRAQAEYLRNSTAAVELQGNADERGSREYNMALGQQRAVAAKKALTLLGVKSERVETISFGEDKPKAKGHDETAWAENRRADFVYK
ncbi:MAG: peptidoglycan-associated lipoprotein Pal, partial [Usitatibacteraceae bacterium]